MLSVSISRCAPDTGSVCSDPTAQCGFFRVGADFSFALLTKSPTPLEKSKTLPRAKPASAWKTISSYAAASDEMQGV